MSINEISSLLILLHTHSLGRLGTGKLLEKFDSPLELATAGWNPGTRKLFNQWEVGKWEEDLESAEKKGVSLLSYRDAAYPKNLLNSPGFPLLLYVKGSLLPSDAQSISIIGTRTATLYGKQMAEKIAQEVAGKMTVVSGLARGIDTAAHEGALKGGGRTLAIIGSGLNYLYPPENRALSEKIASSGALISEFPMATSPAKGLFPQRNRTVSGISLGVCLVESPLKGGGMITMQHAEQNRKPLFALPGRVDWPTFEGNHLLLKEKKAHLIEQGRDILTFFNFSQPTQIKGNIVGLSEEESLFLSKMPAGEKSIEELVLLTQLPIMQLNVLLMRLVLKKVIREFSGKIYKKII